MSKIGILYCGYGAGMEELLMWSLTPWTNARRYRWGDNDYVISAVSLPFLEYKKLADKDSITPRLLKHYLDDGDIDYLVTEPEYISEAEARTLALKPLLEAGCEQIWLCDGDENYSFDNVVKISQFIGSNPFIAWFNFSLKNYVFNEKTYLVEPFTPPRAYRTNINGYKLFGFHEDNGCLYTGGITRNLKDYRQFPGMTVPKELAAIKHFSWLDNDGSRLKTEYQTARGWECSYKWNYETGHLEFNEDYYYSRGLPLPEVIKEE